MDTQRFLMVAMLVAGSFLAGAVAGPIVTDAADNRRATLFSVVWSLAILGALIVLALSLLCACLIGLGVV